ncbi:MAG: alpha/beta hydrolase family protein [Acidobacteriota bacterium]
MKRLFVAAGIMFLFFSSANALEADGSTASFSRGQVLEGLSIDSKLMGQEVNFAVYLPPDYSISTRKYPVLYLLHGYSGDETDWIQFGEVNVSADQLISSGEVPAMIIVMPDGGVTWYVDDYSGKVPWGKMFLEELIPHIEKTYRVRAKREFRAISGLSMGGYGSLGMAMRNLDKFAACVAFSAGIWSDDHLVGQWSEQYDQYLKVPFGPLQGDPPALSEHFWSNNPIRLAETLPIEELSKVRWYIDCGDDDFLYKGNSTLHMVLRDRKINHEYRVRDGSHTWVYWRVGIRDGLRFIGKVFHR